EIKSHSSALKTENENHNILAQENMITIVRVIAFAALSEIREENIILQLKHFLLSKHGKKSGAGKKKEYEFDKESLNRIRSILNYMESLEFFESRVDLYQERIPFLFSGGGLLGN